MVKMEIELTITESEHLEILRWDDDGGAACNVVYGIIPDKTCNTPNTAIKMPERVNTEGVVRKKSLP
jgi:hypothetical protein